MPAPAAARWNPDGSPSDAGPTRGARPADIPDIYGPGAVLTAGNVYLKVTNAGLIGNAYTNLSTDPSGQWPGASGTEYLNFISLAVGAVNTATIDPTALRRVSQSTEWRPPTADPVDRIYQSFEGAKGGARLVNDDGDLDAAGEPRIDEEFVNGRDDDGDGLIDEDFAAVGQQEFTCEMRDDTPAALADVSNEKHVPLGLECRQSAWAYSIPGFQDFDAIEYTIFNRSGHLLDSLYVGFFVDMDAGPATLANYYVDDRDAPTFPGGLYRQALDATDPLRRSGCSARTISVHGFSVVDDDGDGGQTPGVGSVLLFGETIDPLGLKAPARVGFRSFRSFVRGTPYSSRGAPSVDHERYELMTSGEGVDPASGLVQANEGLQVGDYAAWASVGPFLAVPDGGSVSVTIGFSVGAGSYTAIHDYPTDYLRFQNGLLSQTTMFERYPALATAYAAQLTYEGIYERPKPGYEKLVPNCPGCETGLKLPAGSPLVLVTESCPPAEPVQKVVTDAAYTWFNFDCDFCTGVPGFYLRHWNAEAPPPNPNLNVSAGYNYADHPGRVVAAGDSRITLAWDNLPEVTPDPVRGTYDFRSYRIWKASGWQRPPGSAGPSESDWEMVRELRLFDQADSNFRHDPAVDTLLCPRVFVPAHVYPAGHSHCLDPGATPLPYGGCEDTATVSVCLRRGDFWDHQSGEVIRPADVDCVRDSLGACVTTQGRTLPTLALAEKTRYPVGRYSWVDREVKNGFLYFYSITAGDSLDGRELFGRRAAVEADAVSPQAGTRPAGVWVVPNPYRGYRAVADRPSSWDLNPSATDPTGTHIDFMGLPPGGWRIRIYTVAGDLVAELHSDDAINASTRRTVTDESGQSHAGVNRQQDSAQDGEARWNLISRNGQDVVSGIYLFVVESSQGQQRGRFVVVR